MLGFRTLSAALAAISIATAILGYGREFLLAKQLGVSAAADAFYLSLGFVQALSVLVFSGSLIAVVSGKPPEDEGGHSEWTITLTIAVLMIGLAASSLLWFAWRPLLALMGARPASLAAAVSIARPLSLLPSLEAPAQVLGLLAASRGRYIASAISPLVSAAVLLALLFLTHAEPGMLAWMAVTASAAGLTAILAWTCMAGDIRIGQRPSFRLLPPMGRAALPNLASLGLGGSLGLLLAAHLLLRFQAAGQDSGTIAALLYAYRLYEAPLTILLYPALSIVAPRAAGAWVLGQRADAARLCSQTLLWTLILLTPVAFLVWSASTFLVGLAFGWGRFDRHAVSATAAALRGFSPVIVFEALIAAAFRFLAAAGKPALPVAISIIVLLLLVIQHLAWRQSGPEGLASSLTLAFAGGAVVAGILLARRLGPASMPPLGQLLRWGASLMAGMLAFAGAGRWGVIAETAAGAAAYALVLVLLQPGQARRLVRRRLA